MTGDLFPRDWRIRVDDLDVSALDVDVKILRSLKHTPNKAVFTIYNLTDDHRAQMLKTNKPNATGPIVGVSVEVAAGFVGNVPVLFSGDLREVVSNRTGLDWKTILSGDDGGRASREGRINQTFQAGTPIGTVLSQACAALGIGEGNAANFTATAEILGIGQTIPHAMTLSGNAATQLKRVCDSIGIGFSIQGGMLQLLQKGKPLQQSAILLSAATGLLDSPESAIDSTVSLPKQGAKEAKAKKAPNPNIIKAKAFPIPGLAPGRIVQLDSLAFNAAYMITEIEYSLQTAGADWTASLTLRAYT